MKKMKLSPILAWLGLVLATAGCSGLSKVDVGRVLTSGRDGWQYPERVIASLEIRPGDHVAEIGAGSGYWLPWLSEAVGSEGRVYAVEVEANLIADLQSLVAEEQLGNVEVVLGGYDDPRLPEGEIDLAITVLTYHHIEGRPAYFHRLQRSLSADGRVAHLDDRPDVEPPISWFQSDGHWSEPSAIVEEMANAGYEKTSAFDYLPSQSFQIFVIDAGAMAQPAQPTTTTHEDSRDVVRSASLDEASGGS